MTGYPPPREPTSPDPFIPERMVRPRGGIVRGRPGPERDGPETFVPGRPMREEFARYLEASEALGQDPDAPNPLIRAALDEVRTAWIRDDWNVHMRSLPALTAYVLSTLDDEEDE